MIELFKFKLEPMVLVPMPPKPAPDSPGVAKFDKPAVKIMLQVTQIGRFLLERGLKAFS